MDINYEEPGSQEGGDLIRGWFTISQKPSMCIKGGQVLITFEEEKGNQSIIIKILLKANSNFVQSRECVKMIRSAINIFCVKCDDI